MFDSGFPFEAPTAVMSLEAAVNTASNNNPDVFSFLNTHLNDAPETIAETEDGTVETRTFVFEGNDVRTVMKNGEPWFVAVDVCHALELSNVTETLKRLDTDEKMTLNSTEGHSGTCGGAQMFNVVNESGLFTLVLGSRKYTAKVFKRWITHEVLPSLRKHGAYITRQKFQELLSNPRAIAAMFNTLADEQEKRKAIEQQMKEDKPKIALAQRVLDSDEKTSLVNIGNLAKLVSTDTRPIGRSGMYKWLRDKGYIQKDSTEPYQRWVNAGLFTVKLKTKLQGGIVQTFPVPLLTPKGIAKIVAQYDRENA